MRPNNFFVKPGPVLCRLLKIHRTCSLLSSLNYRSQLEKRMLWTLLELPLKVLLVQLFYWMLNTS